MKSERDTLVPSAAKSASDLFREHGRFVAGFLSRLGVRRSDIEDLTQEVFMIVHRKGGFVPGRAKATTWLAQIAFFVASDARRAASRRPEVPTDPTNIEEGRDDASAEGATIARRSLSHAERALGTLSLEHRTVFVLFELEGESCDSIAAAMEVPVGTIHSRLSFARSRFLEAYRALESGEPKPREERGVA